MTQHKRVYREPGAGAIGFSKQFITEVTRDESILITHELITGNLHDQTDKRIKICEYCGYYWRDDSLRNTRKTCSKECRTGIKTIQRQKQRADKELLNPQPRKRTLKDDYVYWLEYPFWLSEYSMNQIGWKCEKPSSRERIDFIMTKNVIFGEGNRKNP